MYQEKSEANVSDVPTTKLKIQSFSLLLGFDSKKYNVVVCCERTLAAFSSNIFEYEISDLFDQQVQKNIQRLTTSKELVSIRINVGFATLLNVLFEIYSLKTADGMIFAELEPILSDPDCQPSAPLTELVRKMRAERQIDGLLSKALTVLRTTTAARNVIFIPINSVNGSQVTLENKVEGVSLLGRSISKSSVQGLLNQFGEKKIISLIANVSDMGSALYGKIETPSHMDYGHSPIALFSEVERKITKQLGAQASLNIAVRLNGKIWGIIICIFKAPHPVPHETRISSINIVQTLELFISNQLKSQEIKLLEKASNDFESFATQRDFSWTKESFPPADLNELGAMLKADGLCVENKSDIHMQGETPSATSLLQLRKQQLLSVNAEDILLNFSERSSVGNKTFLVVSVGNKTGSLQIFYARPATDAIELRYTCYIRTFIRLLRIFYFTSPLPSPHVPAQKNCDWKSHAENTLSLCVTFFKLAERKYPEKTVLHFLKSRMVRISSLCTSDQSSLKLLSRQTIIDRQVESNKRGKQSLSLSGPQIRIEKKFWKILLFVIDELTRTTTATFLENVTVNWQNRFYDYHISCRGRFINSDISQTVISLSHLLIQTVLQSQLNNKARCLQKHDTISYTFSFPTTDEQRFPAEQTKSAGRFCPGLLRRVINLQFLIFSDGNEIRYNELKNILERFGCQNFINQSDLTDLTKTPRHNSGKLAILYKTEITESLRNLFIPSPKLKIPTLFISSNSVLTDELYSCPHVNSLTTDFTLSELLEKIRYIFSPQERHL